MRWPRILDPYLISMFAVIAVAILLPARGVGAAVASAITTAAVALLFFLYGARISPKAARAGASHWRLHLVVLFSTFVLFPLLGLAARPWETALSTPLYEGLLFVCAVPSTVQSAIALTSIARGNVPAAIFSASFSSLAGIVLTPLLVVALMSGGGGVSLTANSIIDIVWKLLLPFTLGQLLRPWIGAWSQRPLLAMVDRGSILLVVYTAVSASVVAGSWQRVDGGQLLVLFVVEVALLAAVLGVIAVIVRGLGFTQPDRVTAAFCGSTKSAAAGLPIAAVLFDPQAAGMLVLPLILYHQLQLVAGSALAQRWSREPAEHH